MQTAIILRNVAAWHLNKSETARDERDRARHARIADRLFINAYWAARLA